MSKSKKAFGIATLFLAAIIWGLSFLAQADGMEKIEGFTFSAIRQTMGACFLGIFILIRDIIRNGRMTPEQRAASKAGNKKLLKCGLILGLVFFAATNLQQFAFVTEKSPGKIAFITAFYMFFVAIFGAILGKKYPWLMWVGVVLGIVGLYFICIGPEGFGGMVTGDYLSIGCAVFFAVQIMMIERFAPDVDGIKLSAIQFLVSAIISGILMFIFETPQIGNIISALPALLFSGIFSCGIAYTLQIVGQKYTDAAIASLIMCLESVFAAISEALILKNYMSGRELIGCVIMFTAIIISQLGDILKSRKDRKDVK